METLVFENYVSPVMFVEATLHEFAARGKFDPNVETIREGLRARRDAMIGALAREMPEGTSWNEPDGGYFLWVDPLPGGMTGEALLAQAGEVDVTFVKGADHRGRRRRDGHSAGVLCMTPAEIDEGIARLDASCGRRSRSS